MILIICQDCGQRYRVNENKLIGKSEFKCKKCFNRVAIPLSENGPATGELPEYVPETLPASFKNASVGNEDNSYIHPSEKNVVRWKDSIRMKMASILVVITAVILSGFIIFNYITNNKKLIDELNQSAEIASIRLSKSLIAPLWEVDEEQAQEIIVSEMLDKQIYAVIIRDGDLETVFQGVKRDSDWNFDPTKSNISGEYFVKRKEVKRKTELIGAVEVYVTDRFMLDKSKKSAVDMATTALVLIFCILVAVFITLRKFITIPITRLTNAAEQMSLGDMKVDLGVRSRDEIGVLTQAIERMQTSLGLALGRLRQNSP